MGFHAYRNIGFSFTNAEAACKKWRDLFSNYRPDKKRGKLTFSEEDGFVLLNYYHGKYRLCCRNGILEKLKEDQWTENLEMNEALSVYHYLGDTGDIIRAPGNWVPESMLDPVKVRGNDRLNPLFDQFGKQYGGRLKELEEKCRQIGGTYDGTTGDTSWIFYPFPELPIKLAFWEEDEEFPAQIRVFAKENATDYVHYEAVSFMIADLLQMIDSD